MSYERYSIKFNSIFKNIISNFLFKQLNFSNLNKNLVNISLTKINKNKNYNLKKK